MVDGQAGLCMSRCMGGGVGDVVWCWGGVSVVVYYLDW